MITTVSEKVLAELSPREKIEILQFLVKDLTENFAGIEKTPNVCGGSARISNTRIPVWSLENARRNGVTEAELLQDFPGLKARDLANAWYYVNSHQEEIEIEIVGNEENE